MDILLYEGTVTEASVEIERLLVQPPLEMPGQSCASTPLDASLEQFRQRPKETSVTLCSFHLEFSDLDIAAAWNRTLAASAGVRCATHLATELKHGLP